MSNNDLLEPKYWSVQTLFNCQYIVPIYQRPYSWQAIQVESLYDDIFDAYTEYKNLPENEQHLSGLYVGNLILQSDSFNVFNIIDGQQRITTFALMLMALYARSKELSVMKNDNPIVHMLQIALWKPDIAQKPQIEKRAVTLGSIDKDMMIKIFDNAFHSTEQLHQFIADYNPKSEAERNLQDNFLKIYDHIASYFVELDELLLFANFLLQKVYLIAIISNVSRVKAFSIFEAINSKGKKLEDIDLIKTFIFSRLNESDYASCSAQWGDLIIKTEDRLYDYLKTYIKAYVKFYKENISFNNFKALEDELKDYFHKASIEEAYKALLADMVEKVKYYKALIDLESAYKLVHDSKFRFYFDVSIKMKYELHKSLFFRLFVEYGEGKIDKDTVIEITVETIKYVISFITICQKDTKDIINVFRSIFEEISNNGGVDKKAILHLLESKMQTSGLRKEEIAPSLSQLDLYEKNKTLGVAIISVYESRTETGTLNVSWDEAYSKFSTFGHSYSLDHIMVQTPARDDRLLKYYPLGKYLKLKPGHDFPESLVREDMDYSDFKSRILHRIGNLRLKGRDANSSSGNTSEESLCTYRELNNRTNLIVQFIMQYFLNLEPAIVGVRSAPAMSRSPKKLTGSWWNFSKDGLDLTGAKAKKLMISDKVYDLTRNKDIWIYLIHHFYADHEEKFLSMAASNWKPLRRIILSQQKDLLTTPYELIRDQIYIETCMSSKDIITYSRELLRAFDFPANLVSIYVPD